MGLLPSKAQAQCNITYQYRGDIEEFYIPDGATKLVITIAGAQGGKRDDPEINTSGQGGKGAKLVAEFNVGGANELQSGDYISVIVGGRFAGSSGTGGGGSFIAKGQGFASFGTGLLMAAGGGGGGGNGSDNGQFGGNGQDGGPGRTFPSGSGNGGNSGGVNGGGAGGAGIFTDGNNNGNTEGGEAIINGAGSYYGHFGGGGGGGIDGGGGGGYSGGSGGNNIGFTWGKGGTGGTSYYDEVNGTLIESLAGENEGNGYVTIQIVGADCDFDNDGWATFMGDCDDDDNTIYPYAPTICNGLDNNCDGLVERAGTIYVDQNANGSNDGSSWTNAFINLQTALNVADCDNEIWVAQGTYTPSVDSTGDAMPDNPALKVFLIEKEMKLYGGFAGFENSLAQRDIEANPTIISGDLGDEVYSEVMLYFRNVSNFTTVDGFTLTNSNTDAINGMAIYIEADGLGNETSPTFQNCVISQNYRSSFSGGSGITISAQNGAQAHPILNNVTFSENRGNGLFISANAGATSNPTFNQCSFTDGIGAPAEFSISGISNPIFNQCIFTGNTADFYMRGNGGELYSDFNGCSFINNENSSSGGAMYLYADNGATLETDFTNCIFMGNKGTSSGGAIYARNDVFDLGINEVNFTNCSFSGNRANNGGAMFIDDDVTANLVNCILWGNSSEIAADGTVNVSYSIVEGGYTGTGNLDQKPIFLQRPNHEDAPNVVGDLHIHSCSPALDAGTLTGAPATDLDGNSRPFNGAFDMGAFELQSIDMTVGTYYADEDGDGYGDPNSAVVNCGLPPNYVADNTDCDDTDELEFPGQVWYYDGDFDGYGTGASEVACERPSFYHFAAEELESTTGDCNDNDYFINPSQPDICDGIDNNCDDYVEPSTIIYVKADANGANDGTSWQNAYTDLQDAIDEAECVVNQIWVAAGTYKPSRPYNDGEERDKTFFMDKNLILYGGFSGTETEASQRDPEVNVTILSGDLGIPGDISDNAYSVVMTQGMDRTFLMDGFTISDGNADDTASSSDPWRSHGGAWYNGKPSSAGDYLYSEPIIQNCIFTNNQARLGGAIGNRGIDGSAAAAFVNCKFDNNYAIERGGAFYNTSVGTYASAHPRIINCLFTNNTTDTGGRGGAIANTGTYGYPNVLNCTFAYNSSETGGAIDNSGGTYGGMRVTNCIFYSNDASGASINTNTPTYGGLDMYNSLVEEEVACPSGVHCEEANIFGLDPQFVNPGAGDFHLQETSPAINVGDNDEFEDLFFYEINVDTDLDGNARIGEDIIDLGCYEIPSVECLIELVETHIEESCPGENNGSIDLTINNATPPIVIDWDIDGTGDADDPEDLMDLTAGTYNVTVTDAHECTASLSIIIETGVILNTWYIDGDGDGFGDMDDSGEMLCEDPGTGYVTNNNDCDDTDENEYPGQIWYLDGDGDGYSDGTSTTDCERPTDYFLEAELTATSGDCDDNDSAINPGAPEICDGIDNNCNEETDEGELGTYYADNDMDGYGDPNSPTEACSQPEGYVLDNTDCDDTDEEEYPGQIWYLDGDGDGYSDGTSTTDCERPTDYFLEAELTATSGDCDDNDSAINPGAPEICDGIDNNCNEETDEGELGTYYADNDMDGYGDPNSPTEACSQPEGYVLDNTDCDDADEEEYPGQIWYLDGDGDGYSDGTSTTDCERPTDYFLESELTATSGDCDDNDSAINPGAPEICDGIDNNCNNQTDEGQLTTYYADTDMDGYGDPNNSTEACSQPQGYVTDNTDCDDNDEDEFPGQIWYLDADGDGYSDGTTTMACEQPTDYYLPSELTATAGDCEDGNPAINPGAVEICDGIDNNCNNETDEGVLNIFYADTDMDGFGDPNNSTMACEAPEGFVEDSTDCNDNDADEFPGQTWYLDGDGDGYSDGTTANSCERPVDHYLASELIQLDGDCDDNNSAVNPGATEICDGIDNNCNQMIDAEDETLVDDIDPEITCPGEQDVPTDMGLCEATITLNQPSISDNCSDPADIVLDYRYCLQVNGTSTSCTEWTSNSINSVTLMPGEYQFEWRATDESGNDAVCTQRITVIDNEAPTAQCFDYTVNFNGEESIELDPADLVDAYDNCNEVSILLDIMTIDCEDAGKIIPVTATVSDDEGPATTCQSSVTVEGLPCGFTHNPDGIGCEDGSSVNYDGGNDTWTLTSTDCSSSSFNQDEQAFIQYELCGDGEITVEVSSISGIGWAGLVMRENGDPGSKKVELTTNLSNLAYRSIRYTTNGQAFPAQFNSFNKNWVRLVRTSNQFVGYLSYDGIQWQTALFANVSMNNCILMGMVVNGFQSQGTVTATFENVTVIENSNSNLSLPDNDYDLDESKDFPMSVFPNPTTGKVSLQLGETPRENLMLDILNTLGQPVIPTRRGLTSHSTEQFDLSDLPAGVYYLRVYSEKGTERLERIVLQSMP